MTLFPPEGDNSTRRAMILIGQYDSPFVRRVAIALKLYGLPFEHRPWSVFGDADKIRSYNPLTRVPTLVLDDGAVLVDSPSMIDFLDSLVPAEQALFPPQEPARHRAVRVAALAMGLADKAVSLFYERRLHREISDLWADRCRVQILAVLGALEADRAGKPGEYWFGGGIGHADIAVAVALRFLGEAHPGLVSWAQYPALAAHAAGHEALPLFQEISQPFIPPS
jgi:glutathione S-transferase